MKSATRAIKAVKRATALRKPVPEAAALEFFQAKTHSKVQHLPAAHVLDDQKGVPRRCSSSSRPWSCTGFC